MPPSLVRLAFAVSVCVTPLRGADAQRPLLPISPGDRVRLLTTPNGGWRFGKVVELDAERLALASCPRCSARILAIDSIAALDVARGRGSAFGNALKGAGVGLVAGAAIGYMIGYNGPRGRCGDMCLTRGGGGALGAVGGGVLGSFVGLVVGGSFLPHQRWVRVLPP